MMYTCDSKYHCFLSKNITILPVLLAIEESQTNFICTIFLNKYSRVNLIITTYLKSHSLFQIFAHLAFFRKPFCFKKSYIFSLLFFVFLI